MYYVCAKRVKELGVTYGIMDTEDGVIEYYSPKEVIRFVKDLGVSIEGVVNFDSKWHIKVLKPTEFEAVAQDYLEDSCNANFVAYNSNEFTSFKSLEHKVRSIVSHLLINSSSSLFANPDEIYIQSDTYYHGDGIVDGEVNYFENPKFSLGFKKDYYFAVTIAEATRPLNGRLQNCFLWLRYNPITDCLRLYTEGDFEHNFIKGLNKAILFEGTLDEFNKWISTLSDTKSISSSSNRNAPIFKFTDFTDYTAVPDASLRHVTTHSQELTDFINLIKTTRKIIKPLLVDSTLYSNPDEIYIQSDICYSDNKNVYKGELSYFEASVDFDLKFMNSYYFSVPMVENETSGLWLTYYPMDDFIKLACKEDSNCYFIKGFNNPIIFEGKLNLFKDFISILQR